MHAAIAVFDGDLRHIVRRSEHEIRMIDAVLAFISHPDHERLKGRGVEQLTNPLFHGEEFGRWRRAVESRQGALEKMEFLEARSAHLRAGRGGSCSADAATPSFAAAAGSKWKFQRVSSRRAPDFALMITVTGPGFNFCCCEMV